MSQGWVGRPVRRLEDPAILRGEGAYVDNLRLPGMAHMVAVRSPLAHARLLGVDATAARRAPGVLAVLTGDDLAGQVGRLPLLPIEGAEVADAPVPLLADPHRALDAETRPHEAAKGNVLLRWRRRHGDADGAFRRAARVVRGRFRMPRLVACPIEPRGAVAAHDPAADLLTMWLSAQDPHRPLRQLAAVLRRPPERCRVVVRDVGGAFGSKGALAPEAAVAAVLAMRLGPPVEGVGARPGSFLA